MSLDIGSALRNGAERTFKRNGLIIAGLLFVAGVASTVMGNTFTQAMINEGIIPAEYAAESLPMALGLSTTVSGVLLGITSLLSVIVTITALRTFVTDETENIPREYATQNLPLALLNLVVGGIVFALLIGLGLAAFVIPGLFLLVSLYFWNVFVIVEDQNFIEAFKSSWEVTKGNRLELFGLGVIVVIAAVVVGFASGLLTRLLEIVIGGAASSILDQAPAAIVSTFSVATLAQAYNQLTE